MKKLLFSIGLLALMLCLSSTAFADSKKKKQQAKDAGTTITLVTSGTGSTKEEATKNALRSALEQTYGAFVSANSTVVNDELVKDEIVSISSGNIVEYEELSFQDTNPKQVTIKSVVSITNLVSYAKNKGMAAELAGSTFAMNIKIEELNKQNQTKALQNLYAEAKAMYETLFDYEIKVYDPIDCKKVIQVPVTINIKANKNTISFYEMVHNTLSGLATKIDNNAYDGAGCIVFRDKDDDAIRYILRGGFIDNDYDEAAIFVHNIQSDFKKLVALGVLNFEVIDNLGNVSFMDASNTTSNIEPINKLSLENLSNYQRNYKRVDRRKDILFSLGVNHSISYDHWMNRKKPVEGEILYTLERIFLNYSLDEIAKVSKIEIRPKVVDKIKNPNDVLEIYKHAGEQHKLDPKMEKGLAKPYYQQLIQLLASKSNRIKTENTILVASYHYMMYYTFTHGDSSAAVEYAEKILAIDPSYDAAIAMKEYYSNK